jgi:hypothetical protein
MGSVASTFSGLSSPVFGLPVMGEYIEHWPFKQGDFDIRNRSRKYHATNVSKM